MVQQVGVLIREARSGSCPTAEQIADSILDQQSVCQSRIGSNAPTVRTQVKASVSYQAGSLLAMTQRRPSSAIDSAIPTSTVCQFSTLVSGQGPLGPAHLQLPVGDVDTPVSLRPVRASQRLAACSLQRGPESAACSYTQASIEATSLPGPSSTSNTHHHPHSHTSSLRSLSHCGIQVKQSALHKTSLPQAALQAIPQLGRRPVVLVVDDVAVNRMVLSRMLTQLGYDVLTASDGDECLRICAASRGAIAW